MSSEENCCTYANQLIKDIEYQKAIKILNGFLVKNENNHRALILRSGAYLNLGDTASAKKDLFKAFQIDSTNSRLLVNLGVYYSTLRNKTAAKEYYLRAISNDPYCASAFSNLGVLVARENNIKLALYYHNEAININSNDGRYFLNRGESYRLCDSIGNSFSDFDRAMKLSDSKYLDKKIYLYKGLLYKDLKEYKNSIESFSNAIEIDNQDPELFYHRGLTYYLERDYVSSKKDLEKAVVLGHGKYQETINSMIKDIEELI